MDSSQALDPRPPARTATSTMLAGIVLIVGAIVFLWYAPYSYNIYKALHVVAILVWVGGDMTLTTLGIVFERRGDGSALAELGKMGGWIGTRVYTPALFAAFAFGAATDREGRSRLERVLDRLRHRRLGRRHGRRSSSTSARSSAGSTRLAQEFGPESPEVGRRVKRLFTVFRFDTALLILIAIDMTAKPFSCAIDMTAKPFS